MQRYSIILLISTWLALQFSSAVAVPVSVRVAADNDDAEERISDGNMYRNSPDLEFVYDNFVGGLQIVGMRFRNLAVPQGATINSAYLEFETDETDSGSTNLVIFGQDTDDANQFANNDGNISSRARTAATVNWSPSAWNSVNQLHQTPDISTIIKEIVDRAGWSSGNDIVIMVEPGTGCSNVNCQRTAESNDGESASAPLLVLDYSVGGGGGAVCETFVDNFSSVSYSNQDGTANWASDWNEVGDNDSASDGDIEIDSGRLQLEGDGSSSTALGAPYIEREADLSSYTSATLTFDYAETGSWEGNDDIDIYMSADGGNNWTLIQRFTNDQGSTEQQFSQDISAYIASNMRIAFVENANSSSELFFFDDVQIEACGVIVPVSPSLAYFQMDELTWNGSTDEVVDSSGNDNHGTAVGNANTVNPGQVCLGGDIPFNNTDGTQDAVDTELDLDSDIGTVGSIIFWYKPDTNWNGGGDRMLVDASTTADNKYFFVALLNSGALRFRVEDSADDDFELNTSAKSFNAGEWHHIAITWDLPGDRFEIYIDGTLDTSSTPNTSGSWGSLGTVYMGDNRSTYHPEGTANSANGVIDEVYIYNSVRTSGEIQTDMNATHSCPVTLGPYAWFQLDQLAGIWDGTSGEVVDQEGTATSANALGTGSGVDTVTAQVCRGVDIPDNSTDAAQYGIDTSIDVDDDIGNRGSINFWYKSDVNWSGGGDRALFDASPDDLTPDDKFFLLMLRNDGALQFAIEDNATDDFIFTTATQSFLANVWVHVAVNWDMSGNREIYINGTLAATDSNGTSGTIGELRTLYFGDNRSDYHFGGTSNSANGVIDEVYIYDSTRTAGEITTDMNATHTCAVQPLDHFTINVGTAAANACSAFPITITAEDSSNSTVTDYTGTVAITTSSSNGNFAAGSPAPTNNLNPNPDSDDNGSVGYTFDSADNGQIAITISNPHIELLTITVNDASASVTSISSAITFTEAGFTVEDVDAQMAGSNEVVAGRDHAIRITAVRLDPTTGCGTATGYSGSRDLKLWRTKNGSDPSTVNPTLGGHTLPTLEPGGTNSVTFSSGVANLDLATTDIGKYSINVADRSGTFTAADIVGNTAEMTVRPFGIGITNIVAGATTNPENSTSGGATFSSAGGNFSATVSGVLWSSADDTDDDGVLDTGSYNNNTVAPGYDWDSPWTISSFTPATGTVGTLTNASFSQGSFSSGSQTVANLTYDEVGSFTFQANGADFLGTSGVNFSSDTIIVGRFYPDHFVLSDQLLVNRSDIAACASIFTYMGENFEVSYDLTAMSAGGASITQNYTTASGFAKLDTVTELNYGAVDTSTAVDLTSRLNTGTPTISFVSGVANDLTDTLSLNRLTTGADGPYSLSVGIAPSDDDAVQLNSYDLDVTGSGNTHALIETATINFGRAVVENTFGSELIELDMPLQIELFDGTNFITNTNDNCTSIATSDLVLSNDVETAQTDGNIQVLAGQTSDATIAFDPVASGYGGLSFCPPGNPACTPTSGNAGYIDVEVDLSPTGLDYPWLQYDWDGDGVFDDNPSATATFGIYKGNDVNIYMQQVYQ